MIEFIKDVLLSDGTIIKIGMTASVYGMATGLPRVGLHTIRHPDKIVQAQSFAGLHIYDLYIFPKDTYKEIADV